jgi:hypothetical protein
MYNGIFHGIFFGISLEIFYLANAPLPGIFFPLSRPLFSAVSISPLLPKLLPWAS